MLIGLHHSSLKGDFDGTLSLMALNYDGSDYGTAESTVVP